MALLGSEEYGVKSVIEFSIIEIITRGGPGGHSL